MAVDAGHGDPPTRDGGLRGTGQQAAARLAPERFVPRTAKWLISRVGRRQRSDQVQQLSAHPRRDRSSVAAYAGSGHLPRHRARLGGPPGRHQPGHPARRRRPRLGLPVPDPAVPLLADGADQRHPSPAGGQRSRCAARGARRRGGRPCWSSPSWPGSTIEPGWTSIVTILLITSGVILFSLGVLAEYLGVAVNMAMGRPAYLIVSDPASGPLGGATDPRRHARRVELTSTWVIGAPGLIGQAVWRTASREGLDPQRVPVPWLATPGGAGRRRSRRGLDRDRRDGTPASPGT